LSCRISRFDWRIANAISEYKWIRPIGKKGSVWQLQKLSYWYVMICIQK
jgi:hypothetical protein